MNYDFAQNGFILQVVLRFRNSCACEKLIEFFCQFVDKHCEFNRTGEIVSNLNIYHDCF